jgi:hypothetical protein
MIFGNTIESFPLQNVGGWRHPKTHRSAYTLSRHLEFLQRRRDTFSLSSLLVEHKAHLPQWSIAEYRSGAVPYVRDFRTTGFIANT